MRPLGVCATSGWNCTPYNNLFSLAKAAIGQVLVLAKTINPSGNFSI